MSTLRYEVSARFEVTGRATPGWPAPREPGEAPLDEEYSRLLDPGKYRILGARLAAWRDVLADHGAAREVTVAVVAPMHADHPPERMVRWLPSRPDALPLTIGFRGLDGVPETVVELGLGDPLIWAHVLPDCGCDACDSGSADLLQHLDDVVENVVIGGFLRVDTFDGHVQTTLNGWEASNLSDVESVLAAARAGTSPHRVISGASWLDQH